MKDIAKDLGLSQATVSKVLRKHPDIGEKTRLRVLERVKELDYQPNSSGPQPGYGAQLSDWFCRAQPASPFFCRNRPGHLQPQSATKAIF